MRYNPALDGVRAVAILLVVFFHARTRNFSGGFLGVDVFFVLSGFLITRILADEHATTGSIRVLRFYLRRARRLYPALLLMLGAYLLLAPVVFPKVSMAAHVRDVLVSGLYLSDYAAAFYKIPVRLGHTWSLAIEEHFYLLWPLVLLGLLRLPRRYAIAAMLTLAVAATAWRWQSLALFDRWAFTYIRFDARLSGLLLGGAIGLWQPRVRFPAVYACFGFVGLMVLAQTQRFFTPGGLTYGVLLTELASVCLILGASELSFLSWPGMAWLGRMSYGWYLWHYPAIRALREAGVTDRWHMLLLGGGGSLLLAVLSYYTVERYFRSARQPARVAAPETP
jgi:peptidoglycan/LPS O-acetylase OafA/YrhL